MAEPDALLKLAREACAAFSEAKDANGMAAYGAALVDAFVALDAQLSDGGYLPHAWASRFGPRHEVKRFSHQSSNEQKGPPP